MNSKGITPLVATILLVAFSVGLGALVMSWGENYIEEKATFVQGTAEVKSGCDAAQINIISIAGQQQACISQQGLQLWIDNGPDVELYNIHARLAGSNGVQSIEEILEEPLLRSNAAKVTVPVDASVGQLLQAKLTPMYWTGNGIASCSQSAITIERLPSC